MTPISPAAAIRAYEQASKPSPSAPQIDDAQLIKDQYLSLSENGKRHLRALMASWVKLDKGAV